MIGCVTDSGTSTFGQMSWYTIGRPLGGRIQWKFILRCVRYRFEQGNCSRRCRCSCCSRWWWIVVVHIGIRSTFGDRLRFHIVTTRIGIKFIIATLCFTLLWWWFVALFRFLCCFFTSFPLHSTILEPYFNLIRKENIFLVEEGEGNTWTQNLLNCCDLWL